MKPILEVLVGKTIEQALLEVMEEEELANLRAQQRRFEELRNAELVETQRLEEQERRHREEKERRMKQQTDVLKKEKETAEKIAARAFAQVDPVLVLWYLFLFEKIVGGFWNFDDRKTVPNSQCLIEFWNSFFSPKRLVQIKNKVVWIKFVTNRNVFELETWKLGTKLLGII